FFVQVFLNLTAQRLLEGRGFFVVQSKCCCIKFKWHCDPPGIGWPPTLSEAKKTPTEVGAVEMKNPALGRVLVFRLVYASTTCCPFIRQNAHRYCLVPPWGLPFFTIMPVLTSMTLELPHRWQFSRYAASGRAFFSFSALMRGVSSVAVPSMTVNLGLSVIWPS